MLLLPLQSQGITIASARPQALLCMTHARCAHTQKPPSARRWRSAGDPPQTRKVTTTVATGLRCAGLRRIPTMQEGSRACHAARSFAVLCCSSLAWSRALHARRHARAHTSYAPRSARDGCAFGIRTSRVTTTTIQPRARPAGCLRLETKDTAVSPASERLILISAPGLLARVNNDK